MEDREVGKLWREASQQGATNPVHYWRVKDLIRKLVEERSLRDKRTLSAVLRDFDIDPKEWK